jgi:F0F1-type ATP synthase assembly protein I
MSQDSDNASAHLTAVTATSPSPMTPIVATAHPVRADWRTRRADPASRRSRRAYDGLSASSVGLEMGLSVVIGVLGGIWLDGKAGTAPLFMLLGLAYGIAAGFRGVMRAVRRAERAGAQQDAATAAEANHG